MNQFEKGFNRKSTFVSSQSKTSMNRLGYYQFGNTTCPFCKSDMTDKNNEAYLKCGICKGKFIKKI